MLIRKQRKGGRTIQEGRKEGQKGGRKGGRTKARKGRFKEGRKEDEGR
jgi:hypothetical protein